MAVVPQMLPNDAEAAHLGAVRAAIDAAPTPAWLVTAQAVYANRAAVRWARALDPGNPCEGDACPPDHALTAAVRQAAHRAASAPDGASADLLLADGSPRGAVIAQRLAAGSALPAVAWLQASDEPAGATGDDALTLAERLSLAVQAGNVGIWDVDLRSRRRTWNAQQYALMRVPPGAEPEGFEQWVERIHPEDRDAVVRAARALFDSGQRFDGSYRLLHADGSVTHVRTQWLALKDAHGRVVRAVGTNRDVTAEVQAALERDRLLKRLQLAKRIAGIGLWETHLATREEYLDDTTCRLLGFGPGPQVRGSDDFLAAVHPDDRAAMRATFERSLADDAGFAPPLRFRILRGGEVRHLLSHYLIERGSDGRAERVLGTVYDVTELKHAEQAMRSVAERLEIATRLGGLSVFERDAQDRLVYFDGFLTEIYGRTPDGRLPTIEEGIARVLPEDRDRFVEARARMKRSDAPVRCEYRGRHDDGSVHDLLSWRRRRVDADGNYAGEIGALIDITELRAAERRTTELADRLELAQSCAGIGVWEWNPRDGSLSWDERVYALYDMAPGTPVSIDLFRTMVQPDDLHRIDAELEQSFRDDRPFDLEFRVRTPAGRERTLAARGKVVERDEAGRPTRMIGVNWDVTERRAAEAAARESAERLQLAALGAGIGSWERAVDRETGVWDAQMYRLFGVTSDAGTPHEVSQRAVLAEDWPRIDAARRAALRTGEFQVEYRIRRPDGQVRWLSGRGRVRRDASGTPRTLVGVTWDVTEAREAEAALRAKETAERASHAKSEFLSRMSHELRTPLNAIVGFTQLLELDRNDPLSATQRERVGLIRSSGWHLLNLINDVLDLARIESGRSAVSMEVVRWQAVLDEAVAMVQTEAAARGIVVEARSGIDATPTVWADPVRLRQVLLNLLSNAVKYNRDRGSVQVSVRGDRGHVVFAVRDTGRGMNPGQISRLFQPFNRLGADSMSPAGTGIGLAISHRLVQQMDGAIEVDSTPGVGSEFRLRLRAARLEAAQPAVVAPPPAPTLSMRDDVAGTLLYIEDNPANSALVEQFLQFRPRIKLYQAADGATGLVMAAVCQPELVLIDIRLPDMMGDEVLRQLRRQPETQRIPCVAVSANAMPHDIDAALEAGFADYWTKPLDVTQFLRGVDRLLAEAQAAPDRREAAR
jgi:PAS domain S-box-containing protein